MQRSAQTFLFVATVVSTVFCHNATPAAEVVEADVVIYGGTSGGVVAAVAASRAGKSVVIVEPGKHLGGMTAGGLSWTDIGSKPDYIRVLGGIAREVYTRIGAHYGMRPGSELVVPTSNDPTRTGLDFPKPPSLSFEPKVAETVFGELQKESGAKVLFGAPLARVVKEGTRIHELETTQGDRFRGRVFIDATYEGDLLAAAGVSHTIGREANSQYGETVNGIQGPATNPRAGKFTVAVDPFLIAGKPTSGPLPYLLQPGDLGRAGAADNRVQSYNYRVTLTDRPENRRPIEPPANYRESDYELLARWIEARHRAGEELALRSFLKYDPLQNRKYDFNNRGAISTDFIGGADRYPKATLAERGAIAKAHGDYLRGFFTFLATSRRSPPAVRKEMSQFGLCRDEFTDNAGWPHQLYVREARRMIGSLVMTEQHALGTKRVPKPVALATYGVDMHAVRRVIHNGQPVGEGTIGAAVPQPFPISYDALTPTAGECDNLLVPFALSASHVAFGAIRMEPTFMMLSETAGTAAAIAADADVPVQQVDYEQLRSRLQANGAVLTWGK